MLTTKDVTKLWLMSVLLGYKTGALAFYTKQPLKHGSELSASLLFFGVTVISDSVNFCTLLEMLECYQTKSSEFGGVWV